MSNNFIEDFIYRFKRDIAYRRLISWKTNNNSLTTAAMKKIKPELQHEAKEVYIRRSIEGGDIFVDIYWYIKRSKNTPHEDYIYYRCNWTVAKRIVGKVENQELPERVNAMLSKDK